MRNIVLASRRGAKDPTAPEITRMLEALGARVTVAKADIGQRNDVKKLLKSLAAATPPLKGIVHSAGVLDDATIPQMTWEKFRRALSPKLDAAWYLHQYSRDLPLAEFVIYSSILSLFGAGGQINYTSANGTLDALVAHRHRLGLPALAINWGPWAAVGLATLSGEQGEAIWRARGLIYIPAEVGAQALGAVVGSDLEQAAVTINDWTAFASQYTTPPRVFEEVLPAPAASGKAEAGPDLGALAAQAQSGDPAERRAAVTSVIAQQVMSTLGLTKAVDTSRPLRELGLELADGGDPDQPCRGGAVGPHSGGDPDPGAEHRPSGGRVVAGAEERRSAAGQAEGRGGRPGGGFARGPGRGDPGHPSRGAGLHPCPSGHVQLRNGQQWRGQQRSSRSRSCGNGAASNAAVSDAWSDNAAGSWLVPVARRANPRFRLFCFPFAGGGSAVFRDWGAGLDPSIEVVAIEPPGRLSRINEKPVHDLKVFVDRVLKEMDTKTDLPFALFGHCLGGLTMYEVARRLIDERGIMPRHIFASGARAPDTVQDVGPFEKKLGRALMEMPGYQPDLPPYRQPESVFTAMLRRFDMAATERFLSDPDLRRLMLPAVRAEFEMTMNYRFEPTRPWDVPLTCFISRGDPYVSRENVLGWGRFTNERLQIHMRKGSHYSVVEDAPFMQRTINQELLSIIQ